MTDALKVSFKLLDQVTPALAAIDKGLTGTVRNLRDVDVALKKLGRRELQNQIEKQKDPLKKYALALRHVREEMQQVEAANPPSTFGAAASLAMGSWAMIGTTVAAVGTAVGAATLGLTAYAIKWASFKADNVRALELITGGADSARVAYERLSRLADRTPFPTEDIVTFGKELLSAQFTLRETEDVLAAVADAAAVQGEAGPEAARALLGGIAKIRGRDALNMETIEQVITGGGAAGVNLGNLLETLAKERGTSVDAVRAAIGSGQIKGVEGIRAILATIQRVTDKGGALGTATKLFGTQSLSGQVSTFQSRLRGIFTGIDISPLVGALARVNDLLSADSPVGKSVRAFADSIFGGAFKWLGDQLTETNVTAALKGIADALAATRPVLEKLGQLGEAFFKGLLGGFLEVPGSANPAAASLQGVLALINRQKLEDWAKAGELVGALTKALADLAVAAVKVGEVATGISSVFDWFGGGDDPRPSKKKRRKPKKTREDVLAQIDNARRRAEESAMASLGVAAGDGYGGGLASTMNQVASVAGNLGKATEASLKDALQVRSPSRVMRGIGRNTGEGFSLGLRDSDADQELAAMVAGTGESSPVASLRPAQEPVRVTVTVGDVIVQGTTGKATEIARDLATEIRRELLVALEDLSLAM